MKKKMVTGPGVEESLAQGCARSSPVLTVLTVSQVDIHVMPKNAEAREWPARIASQSQFLSDFYQLPTVLHGPNGDRHQFLPRATVET